MIGRMLRRVTRLFRPYALALLCLAACQPSGLEPVRIATSEWKPYVGEGSGGEAEGVIAEIVARVLQRAGYRPTLVFLPWARGELLTRESDDNSGFRGTFPYQRTSARERSYYFSEPLLELEMVLFYDVRKNSEFAEVTSIEALRGKKTLFPGTADTYAFPEIIVETLGCENDEGEMSECEPRPQTEQEAFRRLLDPGDEAALVPAVRLVGRTLVRDRFPESLPYLREITAEDLGLDQESGGDASLRIGMHLMASRRNPNNKELIDRFNEELAKFKQEQQIASLIEGLDTTGTAEEIVRLSAPPGTEIVTALTSLETEITVRLPRGTRAIVLRWSDAYRDTPTEGRASAREHYSEVRILNGPMEGRVLFVDDRFIELQDRRP